MLNLKSRRHCDSLKLNITFMLGLGDGPDIPEFLTPGTNVGDGVHTGTREMRGGGHKISENWKTLNDLV